MAANQVDIFIPPAGMASADSPSVMPSEKAQLLKGFLPARHGKMARVPILKRVMDTLGIGALTIHGTAIWRNDSGSNNWLLVFTTTTLYAFPLISTWKLDQREDGPHSYYDLGSPTTVATIAMTHGVISAQFKDELIVGIGDTPSVKWYRFYVTGSGATTPKWYALGLPSGNTPTLTGGGGGSMTSGAAYDYIFTFEDELGRESSPFGAASITLGGAQTSVTISAHASGWIGGTNLYGVTYINVYRKNAGSTTYNFEEQFAYNETGSVVDTASDATVQASTQISPIAGQNDAPPGVLGINPPVLGASLAVWNDRVILVCSDQSFGTVNNTLVISNAGSPTQFSSLNLPTNPADGARIVMNDAITGMANLGDRLAVFTQSGVFLLFGEDSSDFTLRQAGNRGCINSRSVQQVEGSILFASDDGVHSLGYLGGFALDGGRNVPLSEDVDDLFNGWVSTRNSEDASSTGQPNAIQLQNTLDLGMNSWYSDRRYYISFGDRTLVYDLETGGWADTGYGFVKTASRLYAMSWVSGVSGPETIFLTVADQSAWASVLNYFTVSDTPDDIDADAPPAAIYRGRPIGEPGERSVTVKGGLLLSQFGTTKIEDGEEIGKVRWYVDGNMIEETPIYKGVSVRKRRGALFEVEPPRVEGSLVWFEMEMTPNDIEMKETVWEYTVVA